MKDGREFMGNEGEVEVSKLTDHKRREDNKENGREM